MPGRRERRLGAGVVRLSTFRHFVTPVQFTAFSSPFSPPSNTCPQVGRRVGDGAGPGGVAEERYARRHARPHTGRAAARGLSPTAAAGRPGERRRRRRRRRGAGGGAGGDERRCGAEGAAGAGCMSRFWPASPRIGQIWNFLQIMARITYVECSPRLWAVSPRIAVETRRLCSWCRSPVHNSGRPATT